MVRLFHNTSEDCSKIVTQRYSTSFASAIRLLHRDMRKPIFNVYGFVRFADEIVDSFHNYDKTSLLESFKKQTFEAISDGISLNPILNSFQLTVNQYNIDLALVKAFFRIMEADLERQTYDLEGYQEYIYGSAEAVGLMCLHIFCEHDKMLYNKLASHARALGAAFQKVNFLRDIRDDYNGLSRTYFPSCDFNNFSESDKRLIEEDICADFAKAYQGIFELPLKARFGVYVAYKYYFSLFRKIRQLNSERITESRVRIPNYLKALILFRAGIKNQLRLI